jgi:hypothetical protein
MAGPTSLLSTKEQEICTTLSSQRTLQGKRAKALLALNDGDTQVIAAKKSGLSYGQVKYLLTIFRKKHMSVFPEKAKTGTESKPMKKTKAQKSKKTKKEKKKDKREKKNKVKSKSKKDKEKKSKKKKSKKK